MKITRIPGGEDAYQVPAKLVNFLVYSILAALLSIGGYMVIWNRSDGVRWAILMTRIDELTGAVSSLRTKVEVGVLPVAEQRLDSLDYRLQMIEQVHENGIAVVPQGRKP